MAINLAPIGNDAPFFLPTGVAATGAKLFIYAAGSSTKTTTYTDSTGGTQNANPVILNSSGYPAASGNVVEIWTTSGAAYKFVLAPSTDSDPPSSPYWTRDNVSGINDTTVSIDQWVTGPTPTYISSTSFTLVGDQTATWQIGRRIKSTNTGGTVYSQIIASTFGALTTVTVVNQGAGVLDSGLSAVNYALISQENTSLPGLIAMSVAAHATTMNPWGSQEIVLTGGAVTFTNIASATYAGAVSWVKQNAAHIWTNGATFSVQGAANYTAASGDWIRIYATTVSTFEVTVFKVSGADAATTTGSTGSTFTFDGGGGTTGSVTMTWQKVGNWVTLNIPAVTGTSGTGSITFLSNTALDAAVRPAAAQNAIMAMAGTSGGNNSGPGLWTVNTNGTINGYMTSSKGTAYSNTTVSGSTGAASITYFIG